MHTGRAKFIGSHEIAVTGSDDKVLTLTSKNFLLATGSSPYRPDDIDFDDPNIFDSDTILSLDHTPRNIIIYGAGVIGCEYASIFSGLDTRVDLINTREWLMSFLDDEISDALSYHLRDLNVMVRHNEEYERVITNENGVTIELKSGKRVHGEALLWSNGRSGNTKNLGLEEVGLRSISAARLRSTKTTRPPFRIFMPPVMLSAGQHWPVPPTIRVALPPHICAVSTISIG